MVTRKHILGLGRIRLENHYLGWEDIWYARTSLFLTGHLAVLMDSWLNKHSSYLELIDRVIMLDQHQGFVKGLTWDPVGKYLASQVIDILANLKSPS